MSSGKPNDRLSAQKVPAGNGAARVVAVEPGVSGWKLTRRSLLSAAVAAVAARSAAAQASTVAFAHTDSVWAAVLSPDGATLFTGSKDGTIKCWRLPPGAYYKTINAGAAVQILAASATQLFSGSAADNDIRVWSFDGTLQKKLSGHTAPVAALAVTPDGRLLVSAAKSTDIRVWSLPSGTFLRSLTSAVSIVDIARRLAAGPDNELVVSAARMDGLTVRQLPEGNFLGSDSLGSDIMGLAISADGRLLAAGFSTGNIKLYSLPECGLLRTLVGHSGTVWALAFSADGRVLFSGGGDKTLRLWNVSDGSAMQVQASAHGDVIYEVVVTRDGQLISASNDKSVKLWTLAGGVLAAPLCLLDLAANTSSVTGSKYTLGGVTYTAPCGTAIPSGAVCTCNCAPGTGCSCVSQGGGCSGQGVICSGQGICTCNPWGCPCQLNFA